MNNKILTYSLTFPQFSVDFDVKRDSSIEWTRGFNSHGSDFIFVVADVWLRINHSCPRHFLVSELHTGNLIEVLKNIKESVLNLPSIQDIENIIPRGGWATWMSGYWHRLNDDTSIENDEIIYDLLIPLALLEGREGHIAIYCYDGEPIIEVATRLNIKETPVYLWSVFDPERIVREIEELQKSITMEILKAITNTKQS